MERAFISGRGLISPIGGTVAENEAGLRSGKSGIIQEPSFVEHKLESIVGGSAGPVPSCSLIDRKTLRFCPPVGVMSIVAVLEALNEAGIGLDELRNMRVAVIGGVAGGNYLELYKETDSYMKANYRLRNVSPYCVPRIMPSNAVASLSLILGLTGESYDISAACASSAISVMVGTRLIRSGQYDVVIAGGAEKLDWVQALGFCACRALSRKFNDTPEKASRPFDRDRDGFVLAEGAAYVVLESEKHLKARGGRAISEVSGIASNSNAKDMVVPDATASADVMRAAIADAGLRPDAVGYVNTHGTGTPVGDPVELAAIREVLGTGAAINSTKSQTGHMVGATGAAEIIFTSLMLERKFLSPSINLDNPDPEFGWADLVRECRDGVDIRHGISNSFAFGGTNAAVVISDCGN